MFVLFNILLMLYKVHLKKVDVTIFFDPIRHYASNVFLQALNSDNKTAVFDVMKSSIF